MAISVAKWSYNFCLLFRVVACSSSGVVGGDGEWRFEFDETRFRLPAAARVENAHGLERDADGFVYLAYEPKPGDSNSLIRWDSQGLESVFLGDARLSSGTPHGLRLSREQNKTFLYHANNDAKLTKTTLNGTIVWQVRGAGNASYHPTWFAAPPGSKYVYLADGYGSCLVYVLDRQTGDFTDFVFGGKGTEHGKFQTNHAITYDPRFDQLVVSDRENHRLEYFDFDDESFVYSSTTTIPGVERPCNLRVYEGVGVVPSLEGSVAIIDSKNKLLSLLNVSKLLGDRGHLHPHDAILLANGDLIVATWNPGRLSYWRKLPPPVT